MKNLIKKGIQNWILQYFWQVIVNKLEKEHSGPKHIIFCFVDHFEPFNAGADSITAKRRVKTWIDNYPKMVQKHRDILGRPPQHTWFYPPHLDHAFLSDLLGLCKEGYGEIEMHLHHNHMRPFPDTPMTLKNKILHCIEDYSKYDIFCLPDGTKKFAFIHGDWSLANSVGEKVCGVNDEIRILRECGCYADFTFPCLNKAQPMKINKFYYSKSNSHKPKSYTWGREVVFGGRPWGDLMIIQGILGIRYSSRTHLLKPSIEASNIGKSDYPFPGRIDFWIKNAIRVKGRNNWLFIKLHNHGCNEVDFEYVLGDCAHKMYEYFENKYNDKKNYFLHYVTAREMYNIIKAAEAGQDGNPDDYRDLEVKRYVYLR